MANRQNVFKNKLSEFVNKSDNVTDLIPILSLMDMTNIKRFMYNAIETLSEEQSRHTFYASQSFEDILSDDVSKYILSFNLKHNIIGVNKSFKQKALENEQQLLNNWISTHNNNQINLQNSKQFYSHQLQYLKTQQRQQSLDKTINKYQNQIKLLQKQKSNLDKQLQAISSKKHSMIIQARSQTQKLVNNNTNIPEFPTKYHADFNDIWIVHQDRKRLTAKEKSLGYTKCVNHPMLAIQKAKSGDKIFVSPGKWTSDYDCTCTFPSDDEEFDQFECGCPLELFFEVENKDLQIIGVKSKNDDRVIFQDESDSELFFYIKKNCNILMENIVIDTKSSINQFEGAIDVSDDSSLWLINCTFNFGNVGVNIAEMSNLYVNNCKFLGENSSSIGVSISGYGDNVTVCNSLFSHCGNAGKYQYIGEHGCIEIYVNNRGYNKFYQQPHIRLKCIGNTFCDNHGYPINIKKFTDSHVLINVTKIECLLLDNELKGYNALHVNETVKNANILYHNQLPRKIDEDEDDEENRLFYNMLFRT
eukprot:366241_1